MKKTQTDDLNVMALNATTVPMGTIIAFALSNSIPTGWLLCDGGLIPDEYQSLKTALGEDTTPDLRGRCLVGTGNPDNITQTDGTSPAFPSSLNLALANTGGKYNNTLTIEQMPSHQHFGWGQNDDNPWGTGKSSSNGYFGAENQDRNNYLWGSTFTGGNPNSDYIVETSNDNVTATRAGSNSAFLNMPPYYAVNYIIYAGS